MTQDDLADKLGVPRATVNRWVNDYQGRQPNVANAARLAKLLKDDSLRRESKPSRKSLLEELAETTYRLVREVEALRVQTSALEERVNALEDQRSGRRRGGRS